MKKFIAIALAAVAATITQSAQVEWTSGDLGALKAQQADITGITAYYYVIDNAADATRLSALSQEALYNEFFNEDGTQKVTPTATVTPNVWDEANWTQDDATLIDGTAYVVAIYQATSSFGGTYALAGVASADFDSESEFTDPVDGSFGDIGATISNSSGGWAAVPEPTTVALLALGLAAVGLKRKVA